MAKSATGTEYVNAQAEELKDEIDSYAEKISELQPQGWEYGREWLAFYKTVEFGGPGFLTIVISALDTRMYISGRGTLEGTIYYLRVYGSTYECDGVDLTLSTGLPARSRPEETIETTDELFRVSTQKYYKVRVALSPNGTIRVTIPEGTHGGIRRDDLTRVYQAYIGRYFRAREG